MLGLASEEERREFEQMCARYPEVLQARTAFEMALEKQAMENAIAPAQVVKQRIFEEINSGGKVVSLSSNPAKSSWWKYAAAACLLLLAGSLYYNITLSRKNEKLEGELNKTNAELTAIQSDFEKIIGKDQVKMASMKGTAESPMSYATVYWDTASHDVFLIANNLPTPPTDMQYQLWALLDNKPIDLGMLEFDLQQKPLLLRMKNAQNAQAFAITLEKKNRPDPSAPQGKMYVLGNL